MQACALTAAVGRKPAVSCTPAAIVTDYNYTDQHMCQVCVAQVLSRQADLF